MKTFFLLAFLLAAHPAQSQSQADIDRDRYCEIERRLGSTLFRHRVIDGLEQAQATMMCASRECESLVRDIYTVSISDNLTVNEMAEGVGLLVFERCVARY